MDGEGQGKIEGLSDKLYSRTRYKNPLDKRSPVKEMELPEVGEKWQTPELDEILKHERIVPKVHPFMKKVFILALLFFIATIGIASFIFTGGANFISSKNVDISVLGPTSTSVGEAFELGISIANNNNADLEFANLSIQYPQGSRNPGNTNEPLTYTRDNLGVVKAGAEAVRNVRVVLLGAAGETKEIKFSVEYKVKGSNATFYKDKIFEVVIGNAPITLNIVSPESIISGEDFTATVSVVSHSTDILKNIVLKAEYPHGYSVISTTPESNALDNIWVLGDLSPGVKKTVSIRGELLGENGEERTFRFYVGVSDGGSVTPNMKIVITSRLNTISIDRPSIGLNITFNGENVSTYMAPATSPIPVSIKFQNNLPEKLFNPRLEVMLSGAALDKSSVTAGNDGLYNSGNSQVVWNLLNTLGKAELAPGEGGQVTLRFSSLSGLSPSANTRDITLNFLITGIQVGAQGQRPVTINETRVVRISSQINFASKALHSLGPFANYGPIPPKVGEETSYAIVFSVGNTQNNFADAKVTARLAPSVKWLGAYSIVSEDISYNSLTNTVTWELGTLPSGTGFSSALREGSFQIALTPSLGQVGTAPNLVTNIVFSGRDTVTGDVVTVTNPLLTTRLTSDQAFIQGDDIVVR